MSIIQRRFVLYGLRPSEQTLASMQAFVDGKYEGDIPRYRIRDGRVEAEFSIEDKAPGNGAAKLILGAFNVVRTSQELSQEARDELKQSLLVATTAVIDCEVEGEEADVVAFTRKFSEACFGTKYEHLGPDKGSFFRLDGSKIV